MTVAEQVTKYLEKHPEATNKQIESHHGRGISPSTISRARKRLGIVESPNGKVTKVKKRQRATETQSKISRVREYLMENPDADFTDIRLEVGQDIGIQTFYEARSSLGVKTKKTERRGRPPAKEKTTATENGVLSTPDLALQVLKLAEKAGGMERLRKVVDVCGQLEEVCGQLEEV